MKSSHNLFKIFDLPIVLALLFTALVITSVFDEAGLSFNSLQTSGQAEINGALK